MRILATALASPFFAIVLLPATARPVRAAGEGTMSVRSSAFDATGSIPTKFPCTGANVSPPLQWTGAPASTQSFVLIAQDPDAPDPAAPKRTWVHWIVYGLPPASHSLVEG